LLPGDTFMSDASNSQYIFHLDVFNNHIAEKCASRGMPLHGFVYARTPMYTTMLKIYHEYSKRFPEHTVTFRRSNYIKTPYQKHYLNFVRIRLRSALREEAAEVHEDVIDTDIHIDRKFCEKNVAGFRGLQPAEVLFFEKRKEEVHWDIFGEDDRLSGLNYIPGNKLVVERFVHALEEVVEEIIDERDTIVCRKRFAKLYRK
jgi:hypothetical protein